MVYVFGTELTEDKLPLSGDIQYGIVNEPVRIKMSLMTTALKASVSKIYINKQYEDYPCGPNAKDKIVYFTDDDELLSLLAPTSQSEGTTTPVEETTPEEAQLEEKITPVDVTESDIEEIQQKINEQDAKRAEDAAREAAESTEQGIEEPTETSSDDFEEVEAPATMPIEVTGDGLSEVDLMRAKVSTLEGVVQQSRDCLKQVSGERDNVYDYAMEQLEKQASEYEAKLKEAQDVITELQKRLDSAEKETGPLSAFEPYVNKCRAIVKSSLQGIELDKNIVAVSAGSAETTSTLYQSLSLLALSGANVTIVDFTGDPVFGITATNMAVKIKNVQLAASGDKRQLNQNEYAACALDNTKDLVKYIRNQSSLADTFNSNLGHSHISCAGYYHDLALLTFDWSAFLKELRSLAGDGKAILLLPPITSFVGRYLISYLSSAVLCNVAAICAPSSLYSVQTNCMAIPEKRVKLLAMNYLKIPATDTLLSGVLNSKYNIYTFKANNFLADPEATMQTLEATMANNNGIWGKAFAPVK